MTSIHCGLICYKENVLPSYGLLHSFESLISIHIRGVIGFADSFMQLASITEVIINE